jgi:uncharacterized GH25 family protein
MSGGWRKGIRLLAWLALAGAATSASAHDFWIEPSTFRPQAGQRFGLGLRVGERYEGQPVRRDQARIARFVAVGPDGDNPVVGRDGADPAGLARFDSPGLYVVGFRSNRAQVALEGPKFEAYLKEKGLESVAALRARRGETGAPAHEAYSRCSKALILVGDEPPPTGDRTLSFTLELIAQTNPYQAVPGETLSFRLLHEGRPLEGALVEATPREAPEAVLRARTDSQGLVGLPLSRGGRWLLTAVHMVPAPRGVEAQWESFWASLAFELPRSGADR